jgi:hypothetical protein
VASLYFAFAFRKGSGVKGRGVKGSGVGGAPPPPPPCRVGVYFGSFDPIHENHVAVAQHAQHPHGMRFVYLVSNADNPRKPFVSALSARAELIDVRLAQPDL